MKIFVTGADGFIGSHLVEALRDRGDDVTGLALYNSFDSFGWMDEIDGIRKARGDIRDAEQMRALIAGNDLVFHLAALISVPHSYDAPRSYLDTNVTGTLNVLMAARDAGAKVVHTSTSEVYGTAQYTPMDELHPINPQSPYAASKVAADALVNACRLSYGMEVVTLRPFNCFGPRQSERAVIAKIMRQALDPDCDEVVLGNLEARRDFSYVSDTVAAFMAVAGLSSGTYNAGSGVAVSIKEVAETALTMPTLGVLPGRMRKRVVSRGTHKRPDDSEVHVLQADATALRDATGWAPKVSLRDGLNRTMAWRCRRPFRAGLEHVA